MLTEKELRQAIAELESKPKNYDNCAKLATFYALEDHLYRQPIQLYSEANHANTVEDYGDTEFLRSIYGKDSADMWLLMDELMTTLQAVNPRLYDGVMRRI